MESDHPNQGGLMDIQRRVEHDMTILDLKGDLDFGTRRPFMEAVERAGNGTNTNVVVNLAEVPLIDSSALGMLVIAHQKLLLKYHRLSLLNPQPFVRQLLDLSNFPKIIPIYSTLNDAIFKTNRLLTLVS